MANITSDKYSSQALKVVFCCCMLILGFGFMFQCFFVEDDDNRLTLESAVNIEAAAVSNETTTPMAAAARKLLALSDTKTFAASKKTNELGTLDVNDDNGGGPPTNRVGETGSCSISVNQGPTLPLPNGIPTYTVTVESVCVPTGDSSTCTISDIHLSCGSFSSARLIPPTTFRRLSYDDCLVNDGKPLDAPVVFQYANSFPFPMSVSSFSCH